MNTNIELPQKKSTVSKKLEDYLWLIYGQPKIGKSTFASKFNRPLFLPTEPGLNSLSVYKIPETGYIGNWAEFLSICKTIDKAVLDNKLNFNTIVIDTIDNLYLYCLEYVCKKNEMVHPSDKDFGKGWSLVNSEFMRVINKITSSWKTGVVFISHEDKRTIKTKNIVTDKVYPSLSGASGKFIMNIVDVLCYVGFDELKDNERTLYFRGNEGLVAGDRTNKLLPTMCFDYEKIKERFQKEL